MTMAIELSSTLPVTRRITSTACESRSVCMVTVEGTFHAKPGQFLMLWIPGLEEIPLSIAEDTGEEVHIAFFPVGETTTALAKMQPGDLIGLRGPFGTHYAWEQGQRIALVAGGYGAAPMYFAAKETLKSGCRVDVIIGARTEDDILFEEEIAALSPHSLQYATDDGSRGHHGYNTQVLERMIAEEGAKSFDWLFTCGPEPMLKSVSAIAAAHGIPAQLSTHRYMKCGYGLCGNCVVEPLGIRLCQEGPVLTNDVYAQITEFGRFKRDGLGRKLPMTQGK